MAENLLEMKRGVLLGATGGLGQAVARGLVNEGARLFVHGYENETILDELNTFAEAGATADLRSPEAIVELFARIRQWCDGSLDFVVYAAGVNPSAAPLRDIARDHWEQTLAVNVSGAFYAIQSALPLLKASPNAKIVLISSIFGVESPANRAAYGASKHALAGLVQSLAREEGDWLHVNALCPGPAWGENVRQIFQRHASERGISVEEYVKERVSKIPAGRFLEPEELAQIVVVFCSTRTDYVNGQLIKITGGASE
jgi:3-hydroxybutyrate dehydrogenase